ncbi:MAG: AzlD domain-containing protein [Boseongicola sp.]
MNYSSAELWFIVVVMGIGTYLIRFSFLGLVGDKKMPDWVLRHLRYTPVAVLPGLVAPLVLWPAETGGDLDPLRLLAAGAALAVAWWQKSMFWGVVAGASSLWALQSIF